MSICWARRNEPPYQRCELVAGHAGDHELSITWGDDEVFDPVVMVPVLDIPMRVDVPVAPPEDDGIIDRCFTCGCKAAEHGPDGCDRHLCKTFLPA